MLHSQTEIVGSSSLPTKDFADARLNRDIALANYKKWLNAIGGAGVIRASDDRRFRDERLRITVLAPASRARHAKHPFVCGTARSGASAPTMPLLREPFARGSWYARRRYYRGTDGDDVISHPAKVQTRPVRADDVERNAILTGLTESQASEVMRVAVLATLPVRTRVYSMREEIVDVYFPIDCVLSVVTTMEDGNQIEVGTIGREGTSAIPLIFGSTTSANECYCQVPGTAVRMPAAVFQNLKVELPFRDLLDRYVQAYVNMLGQLAACNRLHTIYERCARWLLMSQDRVGSSEIRLTQDYLAMMLGTQRSGVTIAAGTLQKAGLISYRPGVIAVVDRAGLERAACECYAVAREQFGGFLELLERRQTVAT